MLDVTGCTILDIYGAERIRLEGRMDSVGLTTVLVENWIPYMECHKCGKADYCRYALPHPRNEHKKQEIRCGVAQTVLTNFISRTFAIAGELDEQGRQDYLDGAFHLTRFVLEAEQSIGTVLNVEFLEWYGEFAPSIFGRLTHIRDTLNTLSQHFRRIPKFNSQRSVLFVEGWSEKAFFDVLRQSHNSWFLDLLVECYDGQGNRRSKRIAMLLERYANLGYTIYAQGDADGKDGDVFKGLVDSEHIQRANTFVFAHDFESAVPLPLLIRAMRTIGVDFRIKPSQLRDLLNAKPQSVCSALKELGLDIGPHKIALAEAIADQLNQPFFAWWQDEKFMQTELGKFLAFVQGMN